jgi:hypothetical protein
MILSSINPSTGILASDGSTLLRLSLSFPSMDGAPVLVDAAGATFHPWEVELRRWPPETEADLRRGGYLPGRPINMELWCNCAD